MYRTIILSLFVFSFFCGSCFSQKKEKIDILYSYLNVHENYQQLELVLPLLKEEDKAIHYIPSIFPLKDIKTFTITSGFGVRNHPIEKKYKKHLGIDIACILGTYVVAVADGTIAKSKLSDYGYGRSIEIKHKFGYSSKYAHLSVLFVKEKQSVKKGDIIGLVGSTGKSTGPHLHFEIIKNNTAIDPSSYFFIDIKY